MIDLKTILHPTDFSRYGDHAIPYVTDFAKKFNAEVLLLHVLAAPAYAVSYEVTFDLSALQDELRKAGEQRMAALQKSLEMAGIRARTIMKIGSPFVEIVTTARDENVDLIILATHGSGFLKQVMLGSTAEKVVRKAPCPVLTVHDPEHEFVHP